MSAKLRCVLALLCGLATAAAAFGAADEIHFQDRLTETGSGIAVRPSPMGYPMRKLTSLPNYDPTSQDSWQLSLFWSDLRGLDLLDRRPDLMESSFSTRTLWPAALPPAFSPTRLMEIGKNPGLGVRALHAKGITGRGVSVAVIDQPLLVDHTEFADRLRLYEEIHVIPCLAELHGAATASIAVGKTVGVAPEADLYFIAYRPWAERIQEGKETPLTVAPVAQAIERMLTINRALPKERKIRVISLSIGWQPSEPGYAEVMQAVRHATDEGVFVLSSNLSETHHVWFHGLGRDPLKDPDSPASYELITSWGPGLSRPTLLVPMDSRTTAAPFGPTEYAFYRHGGWSWATPYLAGLYALACQVRPDTTPDLFWKTALDTGTPAAPQAQPPSRDAVKKQATARVEELFARAKTPEELKNLKQEIVAAYQRATGKTAPEVSDSHLRNWTIDWLTDAMVAQAAGGQGRIVNPTKLVEALQAGAAK